MTSNNLTLLFVGSLIISILCSCTSRVRVFPEEFSKVSNKKIVRAVHPAKIPGLMLKENKFIRFQGDGGTFDFEKKIASGLGPENESIELKFENIQYVEFVNTDVAPQFLTIERLSEIRKHSILEPRINIRKQLSPYFNLIHFDKSGGKLSLEENQLTGNSQKGAQVNVKVNDISFVEIIKRNPYKTIRSLLAVTFSALVLNAIFDVVDLTPK